MTAKRPNTGWLRRYMVSLIPPLTDNQAAEIEAAYVLAHRCSVCGGRGIVCPSETGASGRYTLRERSCFHCGGSGLTWPTEGLTLSPRHVRDLSGEMLPLDRERESALARIDRIIARATPTGVVETPPQTLGEN